MPVVIRRVDTAMAPPQSYLGTGYTVNRAGQGVVNLRTLGHSPAVKRLAAIYKKEAEKGGAGVPGVSFKAW